MDLKKLGLIPAHRGKGDGVDLGMVYVPDNRVARANLQVFREKRHYVEPAAPPIGSGANEPQRRTAGARQTDLCVAQAFEILDLGREPASVPGHRSLHISLGCETLRARSDNLDASRHGGVQHAYVVEAPTPSERD